MHWVVHADVIYPAHFPGGEEELTVFINNNIQYPAAAQRQNKEANVRVKLSILENGSVKTIAPYRHYGYGFDQEAVRLLKLIEKWNPAIKNGQPHPQDLSIVIPFKLSKQTKKANRIKFESMPEFPGGNGELRQFIIDNLKYPVSQKEHNIHGAVVLRAHINEDGKIDNTEVLKTLGTAFTKEAEAVLYAMPKWKPAIVNNKSKAIWMTIPFGFTTDEKQMESRQYIMSPNYSGSHRTQQHKFTRGIDDKQKKLNGRDFISATFPGGDAQMNLYFAENMEYPKAAIRYEQQANVRIRFFVNKKGNISKVQVQNAAEYGFEEEARRLIKKMPTWNSAMKNGEPANDYVVIVIPFRLPR